MNTNSSDTHRGDETEDAFRALIGSLAQDYFPEFQPKDTGKAQDMGPPLGWEPVDGDWVRAIGDAPDSCEGPNNVYGGKTDYSGLSPLNVPAEILPASFDLQSVRGDFPILSEKINGKRLIWFDNAATTQKPRCVIDRLRYYYEHENSNVHRSAHTLAGRTTDAYEEARRKIASFIHASDPGEIVFIRGATEGINLVAQSYARKHLSRGDEVLITLLEHHANIVPWQTICRQTGAELKVVPVDETGQVILSEYGRCLSPRTRIVAFAHVSNVLGTITPAEEMVHMAHRYGARVLMDGAQAAAHMPVDVVALDCDFYVFSGHKTFGPMGIGVLYGKADILESMEPYQGGGSMIEDVTMERTRYRRPPYRFEAGTGSIADAIALGTAIDYLSGLDLTAIAAYEDGLLRYATEKLSRIPWITLVGTAQPKTAILSFALKNIPSDDLGKALDGEGIAVRAGHHCAQPILRRYGYEDTVRASLALYNTRAEIDDMTDALWRITRDYTGL